MNYPEIPKFNEYPHCEMTTSNKTIIVPETQDDMWFEIHKKFYDIEGKGVQELFDVIIALSNEFTIIRKK